jgi:hypothetical protein
MKASGLSPAAYFRKNVAEIAGDPVLRIYGGVLAALHVLTFLSWRSFSLETMLSAGHLGICWPFFEDCSHYRFLSPEGVRLVLWGYLATGVLAVLLFASRRLLPWAYGALLFVNLYKAAIWLQDYRLRANQHYMALFLSLIFLFLPNKRRLLSYQIVAFYFWAGLLKLDKEWLSGAALYGKPLGVPEKLIPAACAYVVVLEIFLVFGLLARRAWIFWATLAQFVLFHITSWTVVGFFYPLLMFAILSVFPLARMIPSGAPPPGVRRLLTGREPASTPAFLCFFSFLQIIPWFFPGDTAITGEGRLFALHMFDARVVCRARAMLHGADGKTTEFSPNLALAQRIRCDPIVYLSVGRAVCRVICEEKHRCTDIDLELWSRRTTQPALRPVINVKNFCTSGLHYDLWRPNAWILR